MNNEDFKKILNKTINHCVETLMGKAKEYAADNDRLHNFNNSSISTYLTPAQVCCGYMAKHTTSINDMVFLGGEYPPEVWDEKIGDAINYLILLRAVIEEEGSKEKHSWYCKLARKIAILLGGDAYVDFQKLILSESSIDDYANFIIKYVDFYNKRLSDVEDKRVRDISRK
jgi:hypothetical protein